MTAVGEHCKDTGHNIPWDNIQIIGSETSTSRRKIREALEISTNNPSLNRDSGYEIPPIYTEQFSPSVAGQQRPPLVSTHESVPLKKVPG